MTEHHLLPNTGIAPTSQLMTSTLESHTNVASATSVKKPRAAQYVRMSTDHQQYSTRNQADKIAEYALQRGFDIVRTYADDGKSGVSISGRPALRQLIADVQAGEIDFEIILVYDVSRWGRFQDADESAYYEYICRRSGIAVTYCAEQFENDGSPVSTIVKGVKRAMAGEYSRELSTKVFVGQCRLIEMGFRQGGSAGFGLRRVMVDQQGIFKGELKDGEQKCISTHRVILVPGPAAEVKIVNDIYRWVIDDNLNIREIAERLNTLGIEANPGVRWRPNKIQDILTNEKYIGNNVYNRSSGKLKTNRTGNPPAMWIRKEGAFAPIVPIDVFIAVQNILKSRLVSYPDDVLLEKLRELWKKKGWLSGAVIEQCPQMPRCKTYIARFGSLKRAFELVGYWQHSHLEFQEVNRRVRRMYPAVIERTHAAIAKVGGTIVQDPDTDLLHINDELAVSVVLSRCHTTISGALRWHVRFDPLEHSPDLTVVIRMDEANLSELDYYILPKLDLPDRLINLFDNRKSCLDCFRFDSLDFFYGMAERIQVARRVRNLTHSK